MFTLQYIVYPKSPHFHPNICITKMVEDGLKHILNKTLKYVTFVVAKASQILFPLVLWKCFGYCSDYSERSIYIIRFQHISPPLILIWDFATIYIS